MDTEHQRTGSLPSTTNTPIDTSDSESLIPIPNSEDPTPSASCPKKPTAKTILINYLRTLHEELLLRHESITGFDLRAYQSQQHAVVAFAQGLLGLDYRAEARRGEIGNEAYYAYLQQAPTWEVKGKIWEVENRNKMLEGYMVGLMCASERNGIREIEGDGNESQSGGETWGGWFWRKILRLKGQ